MRMVRWIVTRWGAVRIAVGLLLICGFLLASLFRSMGWFIHDIYWLQEDLGGDKATHFLMGISFTLGAWLLWPVRWQWRRLILGPLVAVAVLALDELVQVFAPAREFSLSDLGMGLVGVGVTFAVGVGVLIATGKKSGSRGKGQGARSGLQ